jgi:hypothetical protein
LINKTQPEILERAIHHSEQALTVYNAETFPAKWAEIESILAMAYFIRVNGEQAENLERAIHHSEQALRVFTREAFPVGRDPRHPGESLLKPD